MACCSENQSWDFLDPNPIHQSVDRRPRTTVPQPASSGHGQHTSPRTPGLQTLALPTSRPTPALGRLGSQSRVLGSRAISCGLTEALGPPRAPQPEHLGASATHPGAGTSPGPWAHCLSKNRSESFLIENKEQAAETAQMGLKELSRLGYSLAVTPNTHL